MKTVAEALSLVLSLARPLPPRTLSTADALGLKLAEEIFADVDSPPHDKSVVDGFAVRTSDFEKGKARLQVVEIITAGEIPQQTLGPGQASQIMTGAPIPAGADAVVMVERTNLPRGQNATIGDRVDINDERLSSGQNIMRQGLSMKKGDCVLAAGNALRALELGILAEVGRSSVSVLPRPIVGVLATGNELVSCDHVPGPGQIRNSNGPLLCGLVRETQAIPRDLGIATDDAQSLREHIAEGLAQCDLLLLSGGVSAGVLDLVPAILRELGVVEVFHQVQLKPGKPLWLGLFEQYDRRCLVFGLPGNPVSSFVCFAIFVRAAIDQMLGQPTPATLRATLTRQHHTRGDRPTYWPSRFVHGEGRSTIEPLSWHGSGDLRSLTHANALAIFPIAGEYPAGSIVDVLRLG